MVFATKEMLDEMHEKTKRDFEANPQKYLRRYWLFMGGIIVFLVVLIFLTV